MRRERRALLQKESERSNQFSDAALCEADLLSR
jgi:hypothetical protein